MSQALAVRALRKPVLAATALHAAVELFGGAVLFGPAEDRWHPTTVLMELRDTVGELAAGNFDRLMCALQLLTTDDFERDLPAFIHICNTLSFDSADGFDRADPDEILWALIEYRLLAEDTPQFAPEIIKYIITEFQANGIAQLPAELGLLGIPADVLNTNVSADWSDEPEVFEAITEAQGAANDSLTDQIAESVARLVAELSTLYPDVDITAAITALLQNPREKKHVPRHEWS